MFKNVIQAFIKSWRHFADDWWRREI